MNEIEKEVEIEESKRRMSNSNSRSIKLTIGTLLSSF